METNDYQKRALRFRIGNANTYDYGICGLLEEVGELIEKTNIVTIKGAWRFRLMLWLFVKLSKWMGRHAKAVRVKKVLPSTITITFDSNECVKELGDIHWMVANLDAIYCAKSDYVCEKNIEKLTERKKKNEIANHKDH